MDKSELDVGSQNVIKVDKSNRSITVVKPNANSSEPPKVYYFDNVFGEESTQLRFFVSDQSFKMQAAVARYKMKPVKFSSELSFHGKLQSGWKK
uniref:Uncharacterized protein n=1 Tax=Anopheles quadriannulatus TaxID=34691 RepID=A0A182XI61_ANOQN